MDVSNDCQDSTTPTVMRVPDNIFDKVNVPRIEDLTTDRSWAMGNNSELRPQDPTKPEVEVCKIVPLPIEWTHLLMNKDLTAGQGLVQIADKNTKCTPKELATVQPLVDWLLAAGCNAKTTHRSYTDSLNTAV